MLILASASPRRAELLRAAGMPFTAFPVDIDETPLPGEAADDHVRRLAETKARAAAARHPDAIVLGADTVVVIDDRILGKPRDAHDAKAMLHALSGRAHDVLTGVAIAMPRLKPGPSQPDPEGAGFSRRTLVEVAYTRVWFGELSAGDVDGYVASGEPVDKAGAYAIQGLASRFVTRIDGLYSNVVGLPIALVWKMIRQGGMQYP
jgi:septum formation protein